MSNFKYQISNWELEIGNWKFPGGFTLIELILVVSLSVTIAMVSVLGFVQFTSIQKVNNAASEVATMLQKAKSQAISQVKPRTIAACSSNSLGGYEVRICGLPGSSCTGAGQYSLYVICGNANVVETKTLPNGVTFGNSSTRTITFSILNGAVTPGTVSMTGSGKTKTIQVTSIGNISIQ